MNLGLLQSRCYHYTDITHIRKAESQVLHHAWILTERLLFTLVIMLQDLPWWVLTRYDRNTIECIRVWWALQSQFAIRMRGSVFQLLSEGCLLPVDANTVMHSGHSPHQWISTKEKLIWPKAEAKLVSWMTALSSKEYKHMQWLVWGEPEGKSQARLFRLLLPTFGQLRQTLMKCPLFSVP